MGMYTGLRFKAVIKPEFREVIKKMMNEWHRWEDLFQLYPEYIFLEKFGKIGRSGFIPYGSLSYMPDEWETSEQDWKIRTATDEFDTKFDEDAGVWSFQCSLKNYEGEIESFFDIVVPEIVESVIHMEYYYEEWSRSRFYDLVDGKIVESKREGVQYTPEDEPDYWGILNNNIK